MTTTHNGAVALEHAEDHLLEFFSKAGSLLVKKGSYYGNENTALELFKQAWRTGQEETCVKLLFWLRDIRGGAGNRSGSREIIKWLAQDPNGQVWIKANLALIPEFGRWDDLFALYNTALENDALALWANAINAGNGLAAKWADRQDAKLRSFMKLSPKAYRKLLVKNTNVVETAMCQKNWQEINYAHIPSVAAGRYNKAFYKNDKDRYDAWRKSLVKVKEDGTLEVTGEVNAGAIFPHDLVRTIISSCGNSWYYGNGMVSAETEALVEAQFMNMPNYFNTTTRRIMPILDFSGSMATNVSGSVQAIDVALGLGLYCSDRVGKDNFFWRKVIPFSSSAKFESWEKESFAKAAIRIPQNGYCGSTNVKSALNLILDAAKMFKVSNDQIPNCLLIISDMQFDQGVSSSQTPVDEALDAWVSAGYTKPNIVYWNLAGYKNQPGNKFNKNIGLVSGFSPSIMGAVLEGGDFAPMAIMMRALAKYKVTNAA